MAEDDSNSEISVALFNITAEAVGPHLVQQGLGPAQWADRVAEYADALVERRKKWAFDLLSWMGTIDIPCTVQEVQSPYRTTNLARVHIDPEIGNERARENGQNLWVDLNSSEAPELVALAKASVGKRVMCTRRTRRILNPNTLEPEIEDGKPKTYGYLVAIREIGAAPSGSGTVPAPASAAPESNRAQRSEQATSRPNDSQSRRPTPTAPAPSPAPAARASQPGAAPPPAPTDDTKVPEGWDSLEAAQAARNALRERVHAFPQQLQTDISAFMRRMNLRWPLTPQQLHVVHQNIDVLEADHNQANGVAVSAAANEPPLAEPPEEESEGW